jgi:hypothetical protein
MHASKLYRFGDLTIATELPVADLPTATRENADWRVTVEGPAGHAALQPYHTWQDADGRTTASFAYRSGQRIIDFGAAAQFAVDAQRHTIVCTPGEGTQPHTLAQFLAHEVLPLVVGLERLTLHASAVAIDGGAVAFAGPSGSGKSTMAVRLARRGWSLVADDTTILSDRDGMPFVLPMGGTMRLWPDAVRELVDAPHGEASSAEKCVLSAAAAGINHAQRSASLRTLFLLDPESDTTAVTEVEPREAVASLLKHTFVLATDDPGEATRLLDEVSRVVRAIRVCRLPNPCRFDDLDRVLDSALAAAAR